MLFFKWIVPVFCFLAKLFNTSHSLVRTYSQDGRPAVERPRGSQAEPLGSEKEPCADKGQQTGPPSKGGPRPPWSPRGAVLSRLCPTHWGAMALHLRLSSAPGAQNSEVLVFKKGGKRHRTPSVCEL